MILLTSLISELCIILTHQDLEIATFASPVYFFTSLPMLSLWWQVSSFVISMLGVTSLYLKPSSPERDSTFPVYLLSKAFAIVSA